MKQYIITTERQHLNKNVICSIVSREESSGIFTNKIIGRIGRRFLMPDAPDDFVGEHGKEFPNLFL
jgi:hypothetical protein